MRNRVFAERSRARRKAKMQSLEKANQELLAQVAALKLENTELKQENQHLRSIVQDLGAGSITMGKATAAEVPAIPASAKKHTYLFSIIFIVGLWGTLGTKFTSNGHQMAHDALVSAATESKLPSGDVTIEQLSSNFEDGMFLAGATSSFFGAGESTSRRVHKSWHEMIAFSATMVVLVVGLFVTKMSARMFKGYFSGDAGMNAQRWSLIGALFQKLPFHACSEHELPS